MKKGRKAERGIQRERGKNEKMIKRKGDREKGTRRDRGRKKRKKKKDKVSLQSLGPGRCIEKKKVPLAERGSRAGNKIVATPNINHFVEI